MREIERERGTTSFLNENVLLFYYYIIDTVLLHLEVCRICQLCVSWRDGLFMHVFSDEFSDCGNSCSPSERYALQLLLARVLHGGLLSDVSSKQATSVGWVHRV